MVTAFEILARIFSELGDFQVQAFPAFGVERTGAPIQAFLRVARKEILNRSNVYHPHLVVVFDESLIDQVPVFEGLHPEGVVLLNTERPAAAFAEAPGRVCRVPATRISIDRGLGSRSLPIVNAAMIGAIVRLFDVDPELAKAVVAAQVPAKPEANAAAVVEAYHQLESAVIPDDFLIRAANRAVDDTAAGEAAVAAGNGLPDSAFDFPFWDQPLSKSKTGNWRVQTPHYVDRTPPCNANCPAGTDVRLFVRLAAEGRFDEALAAIYDHNPFPAICGRVCPHFCEQHCNRNELDEGVNIGAVERFLGDRQGISIPPAAPLRFDEPIAVIGAGPSGLTAALQLRRQGYPVTVFEAGPQAGGMMRTGIPRFRLPDAVLDREIGNIEKQGVNIVLNRRVTVDELTGSYAVIITAVGSHLGIELDLINPQLLNEGLDFLRRFKLNGDRQGIGPGNRVAIIGGGNTAVDVARTVLRLGARPTIYYRRTIREMPAIAGEVSEALAEGVKIRFLTAPVALNAREDGRIDLTLTDMELGSQDTSGRRRPVPVPGSEGTVEVDKVIAAIGQRSDLMVFGNEPVEARQGRIEHPAPVFCAGDMAWGGTVTEAIGSGNEVAKEVHAFLRGSDYHPSPAASGLVAAEDLNMDYYLPAARQRGVVHQPADLVGDFEEVTEGLNEAAVVAEVSRCLHCGDCFSCGNCFNFCPDAAIIVDEAGRLRIDYDYCKGCGICVAECPCSAITFEQTETVS